MLELSPIFVKRKEVIMSKRPEKYCIEAVQTVKGKEVTKVISKVLDTFSSANLLKGFLDTHHKHLGITRIIKLV